MAAATGSLVESDGGGSAPRHTRTGGAIWRRLGILSFLVAAVMCAGFGTAFWTGTAQAQEGSDGIAVVSRIAGSVDRLRDGTSAGLKVGDPVHSADQVVTGPDGRVRLQFQNGSILVVGPGSNLTIASYDLQAAQNPGALLRLAQGIMRLMVTTLPAEAGFSVDAPTAIAAVRGTTFIVEASAANTAVFVINGAVTVASKQPAVEQVHLHRNQGTDVAAGSAPTPPAVWGQDRVVNVLAQTDFP